MRTTGFYQGVGRHPVLSRDEEVVLAKLIEQGDENAKRKMIESNLRLAIAIAKQYKDRGCDFDDLIQEASFGLMKAVDRFKWELGFKFSTYASWWIRQAVSRYVSSNARTIKMPSHATGLLRRISGLQQEHIRKFGTSLTAEDLSVILGVSLSIVESAIQIGQATISLQAEVGNSSESGTRLLQDTIPDNKSLDPSMLVEKNNDIANIRAILSCLTPREEKIIRLRFGISDDPTNSKCFPITESEIANLDARLEAKKRVETPT